MPGQFFPQVFASCPCSQLQEGQVVPGWGPSSSSTPFPTALWYTQSAQGKAFSFRLNAQQGLVSAGVPVAALSWGTLRVLVLAPSLWHTWRSGRDGSLRAGGAFTWLLLILFVLFASWNCSLCWGWTFFFLLPPLGWTSRGCLVAGRKGLRDGFLGRLLSEQRAHFEPATSSGPATCRAAVLKAKHYSCANKQCNEMSSCLHPASLDSSVRAAEGLPQSCRAASPWHKAEGASQVCSGRPVILRDGSDKVGGSWSGDDSCLCHGFQQPLIILAVACRRPLPESGTWVPCRNGVREIVVDRKVKMQVRLWKYILSASQCWCC